MYYLFNNVHFRRNSMLYSWHLLYNCNYCFCLEIVITFFMFFVVKNIHNNQPHKIFRDHDIKRSTKL